MKHLVFILFSSVLGFSAIYIPKELDIDLTPAHIKLHEILADIHKREASCLKEGSSVYECEELRKKELEANGIPKDWFSGPEKEYQDVWGKEHRS